MSGEIMINVAEFSRFPSGREEADGDANGAKFRNMILAPAIEESKRNHRKIIISFVGVLSFGSSFLEEAFGGLVRNNIADKDFLKNFLEFTTARTSQKRHVDLIWKYIEGASAK